MQLPADPLGDFLSRPQAPSFTVHLTDLRRLHQYLCDPETATRIEQANTQATYSKNLEKLLEITSASLFPGKDVPFPSTFQETVLMYTYLTLLDSLCDDSRLRCNFASKWLQMAFRLLDASVVSDERDAPTQVLEASAKRLPYFLSRACCAVIVNIAKFSDSHEYFTDLTVPARCIRYSSDIYLQLQCCEVLFCVSRSVPDALEATRSIIGTNAVSSLQNLGTTPRVLFDMCEIIRRVPSRWGDNKTEPNNAALCVIHASEIVVPPIMVSLDASNEQKLWYKHKALDGGLMNVFFGKTMLVLDWKDEPDLTIPYAAIKAIKLNRNKQLVIRLSDVPFSFRAIYDEMAHRLTKAGVPRENIVHLSRADNIPLRFASIQEQSSSSDAKDCAHDLPEVIVSITHDEYRKMRDAKVQQWITAEIARAKADTVVDPPLTPIKETMSTAEEGQAVEPIVLSVEEPIETHHEPSESVRITPEPTKPSNIDFMPMLTMQSLSYNDEIDPLLDELKHMVTQKVELRHQEGQRVLSEAKSHIETVIAGFRERDEQRFAKLSAELIQQIEAMRKSQRTMQGRMSGFIEKLNLDVRAMAEQSKIIEDQCTVAGVEVTQCVEVMRLKREGQLDSVKDSVNASMRSLDAKIHAAVSSTNPLRFMTQFMAQVSSRTKKHELHGKD